MKNFMSGKKKVGMFFVTAATALINAFIADPAQAETITQLAAQYIPTMLVFAGSIFGVNREAKVDVEREKTRQAETETVRQIESNKAAPVPGPAPQPQRVDFDQFIKDVLEDSEQDIDDKPKAVSLFHALHSRGRKTKAYSLEDVEEYSLLVVDAAERKFEDIHGFRLDAPDLREILRTKGKCPYSTVDAYCMYEGSRKALLDVREAWQNSSSVNRLIELDKNSYWRQNYDTSLYGIFEGAPRLVRNLSQ